MSKATYDDVNLILRLYELRRETKMREARAWFFSQFKPKTMAEFGQLCPPGSEPNASFRQVASYWDMAASFITAGVLNEELFFKSNRELLFVWFRVEPAIEGMRAAFGSGYMRDLETVGKAYAEYLDRVSPGAAASFKARVTG
jgi:hypothetical protein